MDTVNILPPNAMGRQFIPDEFLPAGKDEYYLRDEQLNRPDRHWRQLSAHELEQLVKNGNTASNWEDIRVTDEFDPNQILNTSFFGLVRIGTVENVILEHHDLQLPVGITNSTIVSCDIGDDVAIHNVRYLAHFIIGDRCILTNVDEMHTTDHAKFGNGIVKEGESEDVLVTLDVVNETGSREVSPFDGMITADAYLWARYRDDRALQDKLTAFTRQRFDSRRGYYGTVGEQSVVKSCRIIKDVRLGSHCYVKGANKLKNLTINSTEDEPSQIGEGVELVNGIIGNGSRIFYGCKAVRFIMGTNCTLKYGARLIHSIMGDNSTVSCCELLNNLIFPAHEQHHNNSFLVAAMVLGQSNIAAGATIGSNHNSRANDNEILAGRGFWPGLETSLKHSSRFASFVLLSKGAYPAELDIPIPFSLLNNNVSQNRLEVMPAFWWLYNMYALARNTWKYGARDKRKTKTQHVEFDSLAPDTVEEILRARRLLEQWVGEAVLSAIANRDLDPADFSLAGAGGSGSGREGSEKTDDPATVGRAALHNSPEAIADLVIHGRGMEKSHRDQVIVKPYEGYHSYAQMLHYYAATNLMAYMESHPEETYRDMCSALAGPRVDRWVNMGGQLVPEEEVNRLRSDIGSGVVSSWEAVHRRYDQWWDEYPLQKQRHAFAIFQLLESEESLLDPHSSRSQPPPSDHEHPAGLETAAVDGADATVSGDTQIPPVKRWHAFLNAAIHIQELRRDRVYESRNKDYDNPFRKATYRNDDEMYAAIGTIDDNSFVKQVRDETESFKSRVAGIIERG